MRLTVLQIQTMKSQNRIDQIVPGAGAYGISVFLILSTNDYDDRVRAVDAAKPARRDRPLRSIIWFA